MTIRGLVLKNLLISAQKYEKTGDEKYREDALIFGVESERLKKRIETHDYRYEDAIDAKINALDMRWKQINHGR